jgi:hypothetical protein
MINKAWHQLTTYMLLLCTPYNVQFPGRDNALCTDLTMIQLWYDVTRALYYLARAVNETCFEAQRGTPY